MTNDRIVSITAYLNELSIAPDRFCDATRFLKFSIRCVPGSSLPLETSTLVFVAARTIHKSGNTDITETTVKNTYCIIFVTLLVTLITYLHLEKR